ncbi:MAG: DNA glycosylase AlkZ-like family protein [Corynebacterium sp.]|uniref:DNA glycosylase AlkZ-like family protein n=1 Tax=unclassified Corynebacterium TaxID=2624378 RepID=UPI00210140AB|nr:crosslink repair DNA glycosylase YcaQ family protein [Corynebacterium sp. CNJ-954]
MGEPIPDVDPETARADLLRRYLHCYGPSTKADFATWLGVRAGDANPWWDRVESELTEVDFGRKTWILTDDVDALQSPRAVRGVRLLPPRDPYTQMRDRETIVDKKHHKAVWKTVGAPGTILSDGAIIGTWRPRKNGKKLTITVTPFEGLDASVEKQLRAEAEQVATLRGASKLDVEFDA